VCSSDLNSKQEISGFGELLHEAWQAKRDLSAKVSNSFVDELYTEARAAGAIGGKLTGAGGGGFMLLFVPPSRQLEVRERLKKLIHVPFKFDYSGSQIIFFDQEEDHSATEKARADQSIHAFQELTPKSGESKSNAGA
jgi:D-glycero-alpha-D-manno-heptose-7-phosphate kinase